MDAAHDVTFEGGDQANAIAVTVEVPPPASGLAYVGRIVQILPIENADRLERAEVDCGDAGGRWWGVVAKNDFAPDHPAVVYLQDAILPDRPEFEFMRKYHFRVRMQKLRGVPSEVLIMPLPVPVYAGYDWPLFEDVTAVCGVTKHEKPQPRGPGSRRVRTFPSFIPRTDELNFQRARRLVEAMRDQPVYVTEKADGCSMTVYRKGDHFGVCSRNQEIERDDSVFWRVANLLKFERDLADGLAVQGELVGPSIQGNPLALTEPIMLAFQVYDMTRRCYLSYADFMSVCQANLWPTVRVLHAGPPLTGPTFDMTDDGLRALAEGLYPSGKPREGIVIRPLVEQDVAGERVSVKVLNLNYKG